LKNDPQAERKLVQKEQALRKQIQKAENDLAVLKNNLEFFGRSKNADKFKAEFNEKMQSASEHLLQLKKQLKLIKSA
jgi:bacterioferritin (cytochrome b1)